MNANWHQKYEQNQYKLKAISDLNAYFSEKEIMGKKLFQFEVGTCSFQTGNVIVRDPLVYLYKDEKPYFIKIKPGTYPITVLVIEMEEDYYRYVGFRLKISDEKAVVHTEALLGHENLEEMEEGEFFGFNVDAGLATIVDEATKDAYCQFYDDWHQKKPDGNIYDDFLADEFAKSYKNHPKFQCEVGDWINFQIPGTDLHIPMIQSGFGDGAYPVYFGFDANNEVCEVVVQFIDIKLTFEDEEE